MKRYVPNQFKTKKMCNRTILKNERTLESVLDPYKTQEMCNKAVDNQAHALKFVPN